MSESRRRRTVWLVGLLAAAASAAVTSYVIYRRSHPLESATETVADLLDRCQDQVNRIEARLAELPALTEAAAESLAR